ncbi:Bgt-1338 [Blumeria graminis f. sp. tritici]|uniref:Bgt-1338 n=2 Tax=Blumeria graminis f. sp. tritici TaxID=62690 RepID=A0A381L1V4_BLUGR|nr:Nucleolar protein constituent of 66S pre-ribosomal particles [Blumeria graminis f. sp. tritici 96224]VDB93971.1 Bgt-1338 [Blumeria graminis f. sp. tritici]
MASVYKSLQKSDSLKGNDKTIEPKKNKQRVLILSSRGVTYSRKDAKLDTKSKLYQLNEIAEMYNCNNIVFFEARKGKDLYIWISKAPNGPTVKMHAQNLHTMEELHFTGNCLKGSRPILSFDASFDSKPHLRLLKEIFLQVFGVPKGARKSKPFIDHVMSFTIADGKIWVRNYQINEVEAAKATATLDEAKIRGTHNGKSSDTDISLVEIGPRLVLTPIVIQEGSFGGPIIYENKEFVSPNQVRSEIRLKKAGRYNSRAEQNVEQFAKKEDLGLRTGGRQKERDHLDTAELFA